MVPGIFFTAFEPSGDAVAAPVIAQLRGDHPDMPIYALGGQRMRAAGAQIIEDTTTDPVMLTDALAKVMEHKRLLKRLEPFVRDHPLLAHVPVDSPAANWSICDLVKSMQPQAKVVHLVLPQVWAWATWRVRKLRKVTNHVLCLLPFEPGWLARHKVPGTFVGHPLMDRMRADPPPPPREPATRVALLPGSRMAEIERNWPTMLRAFLALRKKHPAMRGQIAAVHERGAAMVRRIGQSMVGPRVWQEAIVQRVGAVDDVLRWSDLVVVVSGTATLQVAAHDRPMVVIYNTGRLKWHLLGRWIVRTRVFSLPNLIVGAEPSGEIVPELVPHFGEVEPLKREMDTLLSDPAARLVQRQRVREALRPFADTAYTPMAARTLMQVVGHSGAILSADAPVAAV